MNLFETLLYYIAPPKCTCCKKRLARKEHALCQSCKTEYDNTLRRNCSICAKPLYECSCTNDYLDSHYVHESVKVFRYRVEGGEAANSLIYSLKRDNRRDVLKFLSEEVASSILNSIKVNDNYIVASVPRIEKSIVKYGIDHAELLGRSIAKILGIKYQKLLISKSKLQQKHAEGREARIKNVDFRIKRGVKDITGKNVILVDDIVTTGASMGHAATLIKGLGAKKIIGASIAIAYKDSYIRFDDSDRFKPSYN